MQDLGVVFFRQAGNPRFPLFMHVSGWCFFDKYLYIPCFVGAEGMLYVVITLLMGIRNRGYHFQVQKCIPQSGMTTLTAQTYSEPGLFNETFLWRERRAVESVKHILEAAVRHAL